MPKGENLYKHGGRKTRLYRIWLAMRNRCNNTRSPDYLYYGGRGIRVCMRWNSFPNFAADMSPDPGIGWTLERKDNDRGYEPSNCIWATRQQQARNRPRYVVGEDVAARIRREYVPKKVRQVDLARKYGVSQKCISDIVRGETWQ
jgi:hypothetical protein